MPFLVAMNVKKNFVVCVLGSLCVMGFLNFFFKFKLVFCLFLI